MKTKTKTKKKAKTGKSRRKVKTFTKKLQVSGGTEVLQLVLASGRLPSRKEGIRRLEQYLSQAKAGKTSRVLIAFPSTTTKKEIKEINKAMSKNGCVLAFMWEEPLKFKWLD
jgi:hypothetical protein